MSAKTKMVLGLVGAAAVGVAIGMLLAPETGANTRQKISDKAGDWGSSLSDLFNSAKENAGKLRQKGTDLASEATNRYKQAKNRYADVKENFS